jgi:hypothetical protein
VGAPSPLGMSQRVRVRRLTDEEGRQLQRLGPISQGGVPRPPRGPFRPLRVAAVHDVGLTCGSVVPGHPSPPGQPSGRRGHSRVDTARQLWGSYAHTGLLGSPSVTTSRCGHQSQVRRQEHVRPWVRLGGPAQAHNPKVAGSNPAPATKRTRRSRPIRKDGPSARMGSKALARSTGKDLQRSAAEGRQSRLHQAGRADLGSDE